MKILKRSLAAWVVQQQSIPLSQACLLVSEPRSGSTWLMEMLSRTPGVVPNFEPLHPSRGVFPGELDLGDRPFLPPAQSAPDLQVAWEDALTLNAANAWTMSHLSWSDLRALRLVLTKSVRAVPLLPWLVRHIPLAYPPVFLLRHPIATCQSMLRAFPEDLREGQVPLPSRLEGRLSEEDEQLWRTLRRPLYRRVMLWCLDNAPALSDPQVVHRSHQVCYEHLVLRPEQVLQQVMGVLELQDYYEHVRSRADFRKPSRTDFQRELVSTPERQLWKNIEAMEAKEIDRIQTILDHFGIRLYRADDPLPQEG